ncbi:hypothetical protein Emag_004819 [Eimeria magna]
MGPGEVDVAVVISDSDQDALSDKQLLSEQQRTPQKAAPHQLQQQDEASVRRGRRSVNLEDSDDSQEAQSIPSPGVSLATTCGAAPRRSARLAATRCSFPPAVSTPESACKSRTLVRNTSTPKAGPSSSKASSPKASSPISICTPTSSRPARRLRRLESPRSRGSSASPQIPAEEDASRPRRRRRARLLVIAEEDSSEEHSQPPHGHEGANNGNSTSSSSNNNNSGFAEGQQDSLGASKLAPPASPTKADASLEVSLQQDAGSSTSSSSDSSSDSRSNRTFKRRRRGNEAASSTSRKPQDSSDTASRTSSSSQLEVRHGRLRRRPPESAEEQQQQNESKVECDLSGKDACKENVSESSRPSAKEVQQRLRQLARSVKQKQMRSRGLRPSDKSRAEGGSSIDVDDSSSSGSSSSTEGSSSSSGNEQPRARVRAPASARKAAKFFSFSRDLREAVSDSDSSGSSFIVDSPTAEEEASRASEEALTSDSSDSSEDEALSALRFHNRMKEQQEASQAVEQTMRLHECFDKYLVSLALSLFSPELTLKKLQERTLPIVPSSSSPVAKALGALSKVEVRLLVGAAGRIERLTLAKRNSMETHAFPPECKEHLKRYPECRLSEGPEFQDVTTRCVVCHRPANRHHCLDLMGDTYDSAALQDVIQGLGRLQANRGGEGPPLPPRKTPTGLVECYEARTGQELPVGAKCGKQAALWHAVHHYKARLLMSIHSILRLRHPDELRDPCGAAERLRELHGSGFFADWEEEVMSLPIPR